MTSSQPGREDLFVPDRFENLRDMGSGTLKSLVLPVESALDHLDERFIDIGAARRGGFQILRGDPGVGKSTFLDTVGIFRAGVVTAHIRQEQDIAEALGVTEASGDPRIIVIEGREALLDVSTAALESSVHAINSFLRSPRGLNTLVVWPANKEDLAQSLMTLGMSIGGDALLGVDDPIMRFTGPEKSQFIRIAEATVSALNEGASLAALGVSELQAQEILEKSNTLGSYLAHLRQALTRNGARVRRLLKNEQARLWTLVIAGNDPEGDVAALTRGGFAYADIERLMTSTGANVVSELKSEPDTLGILGTVLDAKVLHMDILTALAVIRNFASDELKAKMRAQDMSVSRDSTAVDRLQASELGLILTGNTLGTRKRGSKPGGGTRAAFDKLANISRTDDGMLNDALGRGLVDAGLIASYETEKPLGSDFKFTSDIYAVVGKEPVRIEVMWRSETGRATIANYVLTKLGNYAKAIGLLR